MVAAPPACTLPGDMNGDGVVDGRDIQAFVTAVTGGGYQACADMSAPSGTLDMADVTAFVAKLVGP